MATHTLPVFIFYNKYQASFGHAEIRGRLESLRGRKGANVAKTAMVRWLLKVVYHVLKERRPYITEYGLAVRGGAAF